MEQGAFWGPARTRGSKSKSKNKSKSGSFHVVTVAMRGPTINITTARPLYQVDGKDFSTEGLKQAEIVNLGLKELVLEALVDDPTWKPRARL